jgi:hypothetical protein
MNLFSTYDRIFNKNPSRRRYMQLWDVNKVLSYIIGMENNKELNIIEGNL